MTESVRRQPSGTDGDTVTIPQMEGRRAAIFRHELRTACHRIVADCQRMLDDAIVANRRLWRETLGEALTAARQLLILTEQRLLHAHTGFTDGDVATLLAALEEPQRAIITAMTTVLSFVPTGPADELLLEDARTIRQTALQLASEETITIPAATAPSEAPAADASTATTSLGPAVDAREAPSRARILVVDDEDAGRETLMRLLVRLGHDAQGAENGRVALERVAREGFDLIITDLSMPEMDGFTLLTEVKKDPTMRGIPVVVVSGSDDVEVVVRCIEQGAEDYITKPYELQLLQARVRASVDKKWLRDRELAYLARVAMITEAARAMQNDTYHLGTLTERVGASDALGDLALVLDRMAAAIRSREEDLQVRLRQLKREIRHTRELKRLSTGTPAPSLTSGKVLAGRYEILHEIGEGGMGTVYRAQDRELGEELAIKMVRNDLVGSDATLVERLKQEMRLTRKLSHRNIVRAYDLGEWQGAYFLTMEYVKGVTVQDLLDMQSRLSVASTVAIGVQLAKALNVAHTEGVIHRDIKPRNLLVDEEGVLKVMDFGLARLIERGAELTNAGFVVGTPLYMAPEQLIGGDVDGRSDLYSVGVVLYQCLTGTLPFDASTPTALAAKVFEESPRPITEFVAHVPQGLVAIVGRLLAAHPKDRPTSARELAEQLQLVG